ncbi:MAG: DUF4338 domain-containing protein [Chloroflexi bacterium]|nr:DUF4338 domain-containing protein [Chloroflexota bacterium]
MVSKHKLEEVTAKSLRRKILAHFKQVKQSDSEETKDSLRALHEPAVQVELLKNQKWIKANYPKYSKYFADGIDMAPAKIKPILIEVNDEHWANLFRLARLTWSLPFTRGYGRRLRYVLLDEANEKLIGVLGLQSPPLDFPVRDKLFNYPEGRKIELVNQTMDIYTLGAIPPYNRLLGGKLVALTAASNEVRQAYSKKYTGAVTEIDKRTLPARLVALTTTSAYGRSSIYNRLNYNNRAIAYSIGYTEGYGSFHLAPLYPLVCEFLEKSGEVIRGGFGVGPRIMWQNYKRVFSLLDLPSQLLKHGVRREAFLFPLSSNLENYMSGKASRPVYYHQSFQDLVDWWCERWLLPRADRVDGWHAWDKEQIEHLLTLKKS